LRTEVKAYDNALNNSKALESERDKLVTKYNAIDQGNLDKISKMLPDSIDNIRLILEIEKIASPYGMTLKDVKYEDTKKEEEGTTPIAGTTNEAINEDYGVWNLEFSTEGSYNNFIKFTKDMEKNLRLVDIASVTFSAADGAGSSKSSIANDVYKYSFKIKTYWLKN
jgi:Tfp pilus assembly protein PilO